MEMKRKAPGTWLNNRRKQTWKTNRTFTSEKNRRMSMRCVVRFLGDSFDMNPVKMSMVQVLGVDVAWCDFDTYLHAYIYNIMILYHHIFIWHMPLPLKTPMSQKIWWTWCITASLCHSPCHTLFLSATTGMCPERLGHPPWIMKGQWQLGTCQAYVQLSNSLCSPRSY